MLNLIKTNLEKNKVSFILSSVSLVFALVTIILYSATGYIKGFTEEYSVVFFIFAIIGLLVNCLNLFKRIDTVETISTICYFLALVFFLVVNANYLVAVVRAIDVTSVNGSFVMTIVLNVIAIGTAIAALCFKDNTSK